MGFTLSDWYASSTNVFFVHAIFATGSGDALIRVLGFFFFLWEIWKILPFLDWCGNFIFAITRLANFCEGLGEEVGSENCFFLDANLSFLHVYF
jgi:hypothetical protein